MNINSSLTIILTSLFASLTAQFFKVIINLIVNKKLDWKRFLATGGMPSSHSALVSACVMSVALTEGIDSTIFAVSMVLALVVMYDAMGVRRSVGIHAQNLNNINNILLEIIEEMSDVLNKREEAIETKFEKIKELLGHTPFEVVIGAFYGLSFAFWIFKLLK